MHCKDCKYFKRLEAGDYSYQIPENAIDINIGTCDKVIYINQFWSVYKESQDENKIYSASEYGDATEIIVGINFGCIHFKNK